MTDRRHTEDRRRTPPWFRLDAAFMADDKIIDLGEEHGPAGPLAFVALMGAAKLQDDAGDVKMGWRQLARALFLADADEVRRIVATCADVGLIQVLDNGPRAFRCHIGGWELYQRPLPLTPAERSARHRQRARNESVTQERDGPSRDRDAYATGTETKTSHTSVATPTDNAAALVAFPGGRAS